MPKYKHEHTDFKGHQLRNFSVHRGSSAERTNMGSPTAGIVFYETDTGLYWGYDLLNEVWVGFGPYVSGVRAYRSAADNQTSNNDTERVDLDAEDWDLASEMDIVTNHRFTCKVAGKYQVNGAVRMANAAGVVQASLRVNGSTHSEGDVADAGSSALSNVSDILNLAVGDYVELFCYQNSGGNLAYSVGTTRTYMSISPAGGVRGAQGATGPEGPEPTGKVDRVGDIMTGALTVTPGTDVPAINANNHIVLLAGKRLVFDGG